MLAFGSNSPGRCRSTLTQYILIPSQFFALTPQLCIMSREVAYIYQFYCLVWLERGLKTWYTTLEAGMLSITPLMWVLHLIWWWWWWSPLFTRPTRLVGFFHWINNLLTASNMSLHSWHMILILCQLQYCQHFFKRQYIYHVTKYPTITQLNLKSFFFGTWVIMCINFHLVFLIASLLLRNKPVFIMQFNHFQWFNG